MQVYMAVNNAASNQEKPRPAFTGNSEVRENPPIAHATFHIRPCTSSRRSTKQLPSKRSRVQHHCQQLPQRTFCSQADSKSQRALPAFAAARFFSQAPSKSQRALPAIAAAHFLQSYNFQVTEGAASIRRSACFQSSTFQVTEGSGSIRRSALFQSSTFQVTKGIRH